ncbi:MAG: SdrD B-like domain-containing protein [Pyrinomonadaceae bacterium]
MKTTFHSARVRILALLFLVGAIVFAGSITKRFSSNAQELKFVTDQLAPSAGVISGTVYVDYNMNGVRNTNGTAPNLAVDNGVSGVTVTVYAPNGASRSTTSATNGTYSIDTSAAPALPNGPYRIEFTNLPTGYFPSEVGANNGSAVRFVANGTSTGNDFGIIRNCYYCQDNPLIATPQFINGDNIGAGTSLVALRYNATGSLLSFGDTTETGATWGLAWRRKDKKLLVSSVLKRHSGFGPGKDGVRGNGDDISTIYVYDYTSPGSNGEATINSLQGIDLGLLGINVGTNPRFGTTPANDLGTATQPNHDYEVFGNVGRRGIGGITLSEDENTLYVVNLNSAQRQLLSLNVSNLSNVTLNSTHNIPNPGCPAGDYYAPWAVRVNQGVPYVGVVCTADVSQNYSNLRAYLLRLDGGSFTTIDLDSTSANNYISLTYDRTFGYAAANGGAGSGRAEWRPWLISFPTNIITTYNKSYPTPIFSDMEFSADGSLSIGLMDRTGHQIGYGNYGETGTTLYDYISAGDVLKVCNSGGNFIPEGSAGCTQSTSGTYDAPTNAGSTPPELAGTPNEFYNDSSLTGGAGSDGHLETFFGGIGAIPGVNEAVMVQMNPLPTYHAGGFRWVSTTNGSVFRNFTVYQNPNSTGTDETYGKSNGLGDIEMLCDPAPLQIGNRLWIDIDNNGVQDPDELPAPPNVPVQLWADTDNNGTVDAQVGAATSDGNGNYIFGGANNTNMQQYVCGTTPGTANAQVNASSDDAEQQTSDGTVVLNNNDLDFFGENNGAGAAYSNLGVRFNGLNIPQGATITSASIQFTANNSASVSAGNPAITIQGQNVDNAATFTTAVNNISGRTWLSGQDVIWNPGAWTEDSTTNASTPSLTNIVQTIVNRGGWASGNSMAFRFTGTSTAAIYREAESWDGNSTAAPRLLVAYTTPLLCTRNVLPNTAYQVRIPGSAFDLGQPLGGYAYTRAEINSGPNSNARDSDGTFSGGHVVKNFTTGGVGENNHTYDFGFLLAPTAANVSVEGRVLLSAGNGVRNATIILTEADGTQHVATTGSFGYYRFNEIEAGQTVVVSIRSKRFTFNPSSRVITLSDSVANLDFIAEE